MQAAVIVNPISGRGAGLRTALGACRELDQLGWHTELMPTTHAGEATKLSRQAAVQGYDLVLACGGDGTFSQVVAGCLDSRVPVGLIPAGTGNDFARMIHLPSEPKTLAKAIVNGSPEPVDLIEVNGGAFWSINVIGVGFDARVADRNNRRVRWIGGRTAYMLSVLQELLHYRAIHVNIRIDDAEWEGDALLLVAANSSSYGGGMLIAPDARIDDGLMDVVLVEDISRTEFIRAFPSVLKGTHILHPKVHHWQCSRIFVNSTSPQPALIDGDVVAHTPLAARVCPQRALIWMPGS